MGWDTPLGSRLKNSFTVRYFLASAVVFLLVPTLGFFAAKFMMAKGHSRNDFDHLVRAAAIIEEISQRRGEKPSEIFSHVRREYPGFAPDQLSLVTEDKRLVGPNNMPPHLSPELIFEQTPKETMAPKILSADHNVLALRLRSGEVLFRFMRPPHFTYTNYDPEGQVHASPAKQGAMPGWNPGVHITHPEFLGLMPENLYAAVIGSFFLVGYIFLVLSSLYLFRQTGKVAQVVLREMKDGNLKARLPVDVFDGVGMVGPQFNEMADEIEKLVVSLRSSETQRKELLQELVHDLKTPVTSLESLLESLRDHEKTMSETQRADFLNTSISEVQYFGRLVNDLLVVSGLIDPTVKIDKKKIDLARILADEAYAHHPRNKEIKLEIAPSSTFVTGDEQLVKRLLRNAIDNAVAFAKSKVEITIADDGGFWRISVADDGQGIDESKIATFGEKAHSRKVNPSANHRISIGLGAYIMKKIALAHGGRIEIDNVLDGTRRRGAMVNIWLPPHY
jgi:signal transduction histidine kinase